VSSNFNCIENINFKQKYPDKGIQFDNNLPYGNIFQNFTHQTPFPYNNMNYPNNNNILFPWQMQMVNRDREREAINNYNFNTNIFNLSNNNMNMNSNMNMNMNMTPSLDQVQLLANLQMMQSNLSPFANNINNNLNTSNTNTTDLNYSFLNNSNYFKDIGNSQTSNTNYPNNIQNIQNNTSTPTNCNLNTVKVDMNILSLLNQKTFRRPEPKFSVNNEKIRSIKNNKIVYVRSLSDTDQRKYHTSKVS
jgi:hypothetical protein